MIACAKCGVPVGCGHLIQLDQGRRSWVLCCLCTGELIAQLSARTGEVPSDPRP